ncbi:hypothetical protein C4553_03750 [Candidatus Parcubacteria bacterium]|nr:MAG: hypothetical protein C4553_03750 [Candidatus Parcubacteria bacterium]
MKKKIIALIVCASFGLLSLFGFLGMIHVGIDDHSDCFAAMSGKARCEKEVNPLAFATFHAGVFKGFSQLLTSANFLTLLMGFLTVIAFALLQREIDAIFSIVSKIESKNEIQREKGLIKETFSRWLSLLEKRDPAVQIV